MSNSVSTASHSRSDDPTQYIVIARRYRPQTFEDLVGQQHVAQALCSAIATNRVGHAYLFTGARGVGKTSAARILAKALNCLEGPAPLPCNQCDICRSIATGEDIDVLEIDGASNRGIDEIRQLRQNVNVRPSRARFKIYIIDEVHMLTREAFNALLKTLEEPPDHVKFVFCTTEPTKIPITILSRCQRFDFAGIRGDAIAERLGQIVDAEGVNAEPEALQVLARRAGGSMRDSQSLLEQLLAFAPGRITLDDVHGMLGTAGDERLLELVRHLVDRNAAAALAALDTAVQEGVDVAQLLEQLFGCFRDCMLSAVDCPAEAFLYTSPGCEQEVTSAGKRLGLQTVLAAMQILDQTLARLRFSTQARPLAELALVRICSLEDLEELPAIIARLQSGDSLRGAGAGAAPSNPKPPAEKISPTADPEDAPEQSARQLGPANEPSGVELTQQNAAELWGQVLAKMSGMVVEQARQFDRVSVDSANRLVIGFRPGYAFAKSCCEQAEQVKKFEQLMSELVGRPVQVRFAIEQDPGGSEPSSEPVRPASPHQRLLEVAKHPMVRRAGELFGAQPTRVDEPPEQR